jgi:hypothetical protein
MSVRKETIIYAAAALVVSGVIIAASLLSLGIQLPLATTSSGAEGGPTAVLAIRLTDPPQVPHLTSSLNLTYTSLDLLAGEPGSNGQITTKTATVTPSGGSATVDLLKLQNESETIALANLPNDSILYSVTFNVSSIHIDVNNTVSVVSLATSGTSFEVTIAQPSPCRTGDFALLQLNPVVVNTPTGYQLIPSAVGVMGHEVNQGEDMIWSRHQISTGDNNRLAGVHGNVTASLVSLSVSGNVTSLKVLVNNSAGFSIDINALGLHGNFTVLGNICQTPGWSRPGGMGGGDMNSQGNHNGPQSHCEVPVHMSEVVFVPVESTLTSPTTSTKCYTGTMSLVNGFGGDRTKVTLAPGQCLELTFVGVLSLGEAPFILIPSTGTGQTYVLTVIGSNGAHQMIQCSLPLTAKGCTAYSPEQQDMDW